MMQTANVEKIAPLSAYVSRAKAAAIVGISDRTLQRYIDDELVPELDVLRLPSGQFRISRVSALRLRDRLRTGDEAAPIMPQAATLAEPDLLSAFLPK